MLTFQLYILYCFILLLREEVDHLIDLKVSEVGQKEMDLLIQLNGMVLLVLEKNYLVGLAEVLLWKAIGEDIEMAGKMMMVGVSGVSKFFLF